MSPTERSRLLELIDSVAAITRCIYEPIVHGLGAAGRIVKRAGMLVVSQFEFWLLAAFKMSSGVSLTEMGSDAPMKAITVPRC